MQKIFRTIKPKKTDMAMPMKEPKKHLPMFHIGMETLKEAMDWEVGNEYEIHMKVKMTGKYHSEMDGGEPHGNADFEITAIRAGDKTNSREEKKEAPKKVSRYA